MIVVNVVIAIKYSVLNTKSKEIYKPVNALANIVIAAKKTFRLMHCIVYPKLFPESDDHLNFKYVAFQL